MAEGNPHHLKKFIRDLSVSDTGAEDHRRSSKKIYKPWKYANVFAIFVLRNDFVPSYFYIYAENTVGEQISKSVERVYVK